MGNEPIRLLQIHNRVHLGGPIYIIAFIHRHLPSDAYDNKLLIGPVLPDELSADFFLSQEGVAYTLIPEMRRSVGIGDDIRALRRIRRIMRDFKPHIVHTHTAKAGALGRIAAWMERVPVTVHTFHGHVFEQYFSAVVSRAIVLVERALAKKTTQIIAISNRQRHDLVERFNVVEPDKCKVVPLGLDLDRFTSNLLEKRQIHRQRFGLADSDIAVALVGRFAPVKNHTLLIDALGFIKQKDPQTFERIVVFFVGDGDLKSVFQERLASLGIPYADKRPAFTGGGVVFTSWIKDMDAIMPAFDIVALSSKNEGTPLSIIEAQAAGVPVICTDVGGVADTMVSNETGILVEAGNAELFGQELAALATDASRRTAMGIKARDFAVQSFSKESLVANMDAMYKQLLGQQGLLSVKNDEPLDRRISVITVARNAVRTIRETIESVRSQHGVDVEHIIVDGGSTDGTVDIIRDYPHITKFVSEPDEGIYAAMNKGIRMAEGETIGFLNADDVYADRHVLRDVLRLQLASGSDAVYGDLVYVNNGKLFRYWKAGVFTRKKMRFGWMPPHPTFFVSAKVFQRHGMFLDGLTQSADYELCLRLLYKHQVSVAYLPRILVKMRVGGISNASFRNRLRANLQDYQAWQANGLSTSRFKLWLKPLGKIIQYLVLPGGSNQS